MKCEGLQKKEYWNNSVYHYYSELQHNDCADYISQAMFHAGVAEDGTWWATQGSTARSATWVSVSRLEAHMLSRGVWTEVDVDEVVIGDIVVMPGHVVAITYRNGDSFLMSGHTRDRLNCTFTLKSTYTYYRLDFNK